MADLSKNPGEPDPGEFDPYRYGAPTPPPPTRNPVSIEGARPTGKQILTASWQLLKRDRSMIMLPVIGTLAGFAALIIFFIPGALIGLTGGHHNTGVVYAFTVVGGFIASVIGIYFQAALVIGAFQRADGQDPTVSGVLSVAWRMRGKILSWAVFTTIVGTVIRALEQRLGIIGKIIGFLGGIAWAVATFFAIPVIIAEGVGPIEAVKRSAGVIRQIWGTSVRTTLRFGLIYFAMLIVPIILVITGVSVAAGAAAGGTGGGVAGGIVLAAIGGLLLIGLGIVFGAIAMYARAMIYRWATGRPVPGIDPALFAGAFRPRRGRRG